ncbi:helix-turn-helix domain-containing protein [Halocatena pleomorpha]|uniref:TrmB family transcriptional regulator n=1 Tax=Halocatena pleomorpha TaxID=1785090 RepID=A0A3P3RF57_9EURY|nr:TrmB family transcriptional regulator [Halocatena pleomorpha]
MTGIGPDSECFRNLIADSEPGFENVIRCVFGIQHHEIQTYQTLLERPGSTVEELAVVLERDRLNINCSLSTLREKGFADRVRRLLDDGGHIYQYSEKPVPEAMKLMHETLDKWTAYVYACIDELSEDEGPSSQPSTPPFSVGESFTVETWPDCVFPLARDKY